MQRALILAGIALIALGLLWPWLSKLGPGLGFNFGLGLGRLPGDIVIHRQGFSLYVRS